MKSELTPYSLICVPTCSAHDRDPNLYVTEASSGFMNWVGFELSDRVVRPLADLDNACTPSDSICSATGFIR